MHEKKTAVAKKPRARPETRQKLVDAAHALIWANSYARVSVEDICREAGVQKGSFYHFFPTKSDLAAAALEDKWLAGCTHFEALFTEYPEPRAQLHALCQSILAKQEEGLATTGMVCGCPYATLASEMSGDTAPLRQLSEQLSDSFRGYFERILKNAAKAGLIETQGIKRIAGEMHTYTIGAMMQARLMNSLDLVGKPLEDTLLRISGMKAAKAKKRA